MNPRRRATFALPLAVLANGAMAQSAKGSKVYRIGWLGTAPPDAIWDSFVDGLRERGWVEGENVTFDRLFSEGRNERFPALAAELVARNIDVIVTSGTPPTVAASRVTTTIPIVFLSVGDPVGAGVVESLARPGRNLTGTGGLAAGMHVKQLELLKEVVPNASRIAMLVNNDFPLHSVIRAEIEPVRRRLGLTLLPIQLKNPEDVESAFAAIARAKVDALFILGQPLLYQERARLAKLALDQRLPAINPFDLVTQAGILMSYAGRLVDEARRIPYYVDRILRDAKPAELPVEQSTTFYRAINVRTAKAIGMTIPRSTLARADQLIE